MTKVNLLDIDKVFETAKQQISKNGKICKIVKLVEYSVKSAKKIVENIYKDKHDT